MSIHFGGRTLARSQAFQLLFQAEANHLTVEEVLGKDYVIEKGPLDEFARQLALGADAARHDLDAVIASRSVTWTLRRMPSMDRNLLRLAIYEMLFVDEVEIPVTINESVELAKAYGTDDSSRFVNGILGRVADDVEAGVDVVARAHETLAERGEDEDDLMAEPTVAEPAPVPAEAEVFEPVSDEEYDDYEGGYEDDYAYEDDNDGYWELAHRTRRERDQAAPVEHKPFGSDMAPQEGELTGVFIRREETDDDGEGW